MIKIGKSKSPKVPLSYQSHQYDPVIPFEALCFDYSDVETKPDADYS